MYYYDSHKTIRVEREAIERSPGQFVYKYRERETVYRKLKPERVDVIPTDDFTAFLDQIIEKPGTPLPAIKNRSAELIPGKLYVNGLDTVYKLEKIIRNDTYNTLVMSYISGELGHKRLMRKDQCEMFGLEYKKNMMLFPASGIAWQQYDPDYKEFDSKDLSTYPTSTLEDSKDTIRYMILKLGGFKRLSDDSIIQTPSGDYLDLELFIVSLRVSIKEKISGIGIYPGFEKGEDIPWSIITDDFKGSEKVGDDDIIDTDGNIYLIIKTVKGTSGISPLSLAGKRAGDIFEVSWDSSFGIRKDGSEVKEISRESPEVPRYDADLFRSEGQIVWRVLDSKSKDFQRYSQLIQRS